MTTPFRRIAAALAACAALAVPAAAQAQGRVIWNGNVDDTAIIYIHGRNVETRTISGHSVSHSSAQFTGQMPRRQMFVSLRRAEGRGRIRLVQQPSRSNGFTAGVRIHDPQHGSSNYRFILHWG